MAKYDEAEARKTDRAYLTPDITRQRMRTLGALQLEAGECVLDVGCGTGLLADDMATLVGAGGRVVGVDTSKDMLTLAEQRCADLPQVNLKRANAESLPEEDESFDAVVCVQVLLYLPDVPTALSEMHRVLRPGGRIAIVETDWRGTVLNSLDESLTRQMLAAWDDAVPSPNLPVRLRPLMKAQGFSAVSVDAFPIVNTSRTPGDFSTNMLEQFAHYAQEQGSVRAEEAKAWLVDLRAKGEDGSYFFCVNRFIFTAVKI
jgi:ubiquinone/menaquinone biosynthesis C-methylase UbiE